LSQDWLWWRLGLKMNTYLHCPHELCPIENKVRNPLSSHISRIGTRQNIGVSHPVLCEAGVTNKRKLILSYSHTPIGYQSMRLDRQSRKRDLIGYYREDLIQ